jgi:hypothetical protein
LPVLYGDLIDHTPLHHTPATFTAAAFTAAATAGVAVVILRSRCLPWRVFKRSASCQKKIDKERGERPKSAHPAGPDAGSVTGHRSEATGSPAQHGQMRSAGRSTGASTPPIPMRAFAGKGWVGKATDRDPAPCSARSPPNQPLLPQFGQNGTEFTTRFVPCDIKFALIGRPACHPDAPIAAFRHSDA